MFPLQSANTASGYYLQRSLRFRASSSAYLNRTQGTPTNNLKWTWSGWLKRGKLDSSARFVIYGTVSIDVTKQNYFAFDADQLYYLHYDGTTSSSLRTSQVFRDPSAWYHLVVAVDNSQATASNRVKIYVNGSQVTAFASASYPAQNATNYINQATAVNGIGAYPPYLTNSFYDGYMTEINFVDGQQLTPSSFGSTNSTTSVWQPAKYTGTYGTNGFYLPFTDNSALTTSSNVGLGKDFSGNGNYWTTNNISITSGVTYDSMTDVPTLTSATAANYCVMNPLYFGGSAYSNGNLTVAFGTAVGTQCGTFGITSGKWYWETTVSTLGSQPFAGGIKLATEANSNYPGITAGSYGYFYNGNKYNNNTATAYGASYTTGDVIGTAYDADARTLTFYKNGVSQGTAFTSIPAGTYYPAIACYDGIFNLNFGQQPITLPSGFVALNAYNLPDSTIKKGSTAMNIALDTGANIKATTEALFTGQFFDWIKDLANTNNHQLMNSVRGLTAVTQSNTQSAETTYTVPSGNSVGYAWKAGSSSSSNTSGTITSTTSVNASAGQAIVTYQGNAIAGATFGHGLGVAPSFGIFKNLSAATDWQVYHSALGGNAASFLNTTGAASTSSLWWNNTAPTSSVMTLGSISYVNGSGNNILAMLWTEIAGYSKFGMYTGNGSADGPMIYTGMRGRWLLIKAIPAVSGGNWVLIDTANNTYNVCNNWLFPDSTTAISNYITVADINSNGFKIRASWDSINASGSTYMYAMFAENPFKNALAR